MSAHYLLVKHSEGWNVDRVSLWFEQNAVAHQWCYPASGQALPSPREHFTGVIVFGGANSANDNDDWLNRELNFIERCVADDTPFFGICLGAQLLARALGAGVAVHEEGLNEIGFHLVEPLESERPLLHEPIKFMQWHSEGFEIPQGCEPLATARYGFPNQAFRFRPHCVGVQFHPEVNEAVLRHWHQRNRQRRPGQLNELIRRRMIRDAAQQRPVLDDWLDTFLRHWTALAVEQQLR